MNSILIAGPSWPRVARHQQPGNGEIRLTGADDISYVALILIAHYFEAHKFLPPRQFVDAVLTNECD
jgi:hypothetical protein